jgi:hypothetical protein
MKIMKLAEFRWVRVITSQTTSGQIISLIGTTDSHDRDCDIDVLILRHLSQMENEKIKRVFTGITYMDAEGSMYSRELFKEGVND